MAIARGVDVLDMSLHRKRLYRCRVRIQIVNILVREWLPMRSVDIAPDGCETRFHDGEVEVEGIRRVGVVVKHFWCDVWHLGLVMSGPSVRERERDLP